MIEDRLQIICNADEKANVNRERRALAEAELVNLLDAAERRPLRDAMTIRRGSRKGKIAAKVSDVQRERLERLGRGRRLIYMTLVLTGLRRGEREALRLRDVEREAEGVNHKLLRLHD